MIVAFRGEIVIVERWGKLRHRTEPMATVATPLGALRTERSEPA